MIQFSMAPNARSCTRNPTFDIPQPSTIRLEANDVVSGPKDFDQLLCQSSLETNYSSPALINRCGPRIERDVPIVDRFEQSPEKLLRPVERKAGTIPSTATRKPDVLHSYATTAFK